MRYLFLLSLCFLISGAVAAQGFIDHKKSYVRKHVARQYDDTQLKFEKSETDSTITYQLRDSSWLPVTRIFFFNDAGKCYRQDQIYTCDSCAEKFVQYALNLKFHSWKEQAAGVYVSKFPYYDMMEKLREADQFIVRFTDKRVLR